MNPRQKTVFGPHVAQLRVLERLLGKRHLCEHFATIVEFGRRYFDVAASRAGADPATASHWAAEPVSLVEAAPGAVWAWSLVATP